MRVERCSWTISYAPVRSPLGASSEVGLSLTHTPRGLVLHDGDSVLSERSSFNAHTLALDAPALDATARYTRSRTRRARYATALRRTMASLSTMASWCMARTLTCACTQVKSTREFAFARHDFACAVARCAQYWSQLECSLSMRHRS